MESHRLTGQDAAQLLRDGGCCEEFVQQFLKAMETESVKSQLELLRTQRRCRLQCLHTEGKKLDCLDDLRYQLEKQLPAGAKPNQRRR